MLKPNELLRNKVLENPKSTLLVVDDTPENIDVLLGIFSTTYAVKVATSGTVALKIVERQRPDLILLDVMMPGMSGYDVCKVLKSKAETADIPVIFVTAMSDAADEEEGLSLGAVDYITKPVNSAIVKVRVKSHLALANQRKACEETVIARTHELERSQKAAVFMLGEAGHYNDTDTGLHIWRMAAYAAALARAMLWATDKVNLLEMAAPMHDTGKIGIPDGILKAPRALTGDEWVVMKTHSEIGHRILSKSDTPLFQMAAEIALAHHEKWDGSGYPNGLKGEDIPLSARIVAVCDVFDALTMRRPYKEAWSTDKALEALKADAGKHFQRELVDKFIQIIDEILAIKQSWEATEDMNEND